MFEVVHDEYGSQQTQEVCQETWVEVGPFIFVHTEMQIKKPWGLYHI